MRGTFDQVIALTSNPAGGIVLENVQEYAKNLDLDESEVLSYLTLVENTHARLFNSVPWLMPQFKALISKYARSISIDLDAMEQELREAQAMNPESIAGAVNLSKVGMSDSPEQREALQRLETLLALVEGWVDCIVWRAGIPYLPHIEQLREMLRRERVTGGAAARSFEALVGLHLHPKKMREASDMWDTLTLAEGVDGRDARWQHPDTLPVLADDVMRELKDSSSASPLDDEIETMSSELFEQEKNDEGTDSSPSTHPVGTASSIDWDSELSQLLDAEKPEEEKPEDEDPDKD